MNNEKETVNQEAAVETEVVEKTFNQTELDQIITDRLKREREKYSDYEALKEKATKYDELEEANKSELQKATERAEKLESELTQLKQAEEIRQIRDKVAKETGVPINLLTAETEEACTEQANAIKAYAVPNSYPTIKDGGEVHITQKGTARDEFAAWANAINN